MDRERFYKIWDAPDPIIFRKFADTQLSPLEQEAGERQGETNKQEAATEVVVYEQHAASEFLRLANSLAEMEQTIEDPVTASAFTEFRKQALERTLTAHQRIGQDTTRHDPKP